MTLGLKLRLYS